MEEYSCEGTIQSGNKEEFISRASLQLADEIQTCDFCGADIFQNYFKCLGQKQGEEDFIVCPGCYVEGRTCACQSMERRERQSFDILLNARWDALQALTDVGYSLKSFEGTLSLQEQRWYAVNRLYSTIPLIIHGTVSLRSRRNKVYFTQLFCYPRSEQPRYVLIKICIS